MQKKNICNQNKHIKHITYNTNKNKTCTLVHVFSNELLGSLIKERKKIYKEKRKKILI